METPGEDPRALESRLLSRFRQLHGAPPSGWLRTVYAVEGTLEPSYNVAPDLDEFLAALEP